MASRLKIKRRNRIMEEKARLAAEKAEMVPVEAKTAPVGPVEEVMATPTTLEEEKPAEELTEAPAEAAVLEEEEKAPVKKAGRPRKKKTTE